MRVFLLFWLPPLLSISFLLTDRLSEPFTITYDMGIQLNATENLLANGRLTADHFASYEPDLLAKPQTSYLTWFPPGFSVIIAALRTTGMSLVASLRVFDSFMLLSGWIGWFSLAWFASSQTLNRKPYHLFWIVPALMAMPLALSPWAGGTDSALFAATPWVLICLFRYYENGAWRYAVGAGILVAALVAFRYAALFLAPLFLIGLLPIVVHNWRVTARFAAISIAAFALGMVPLLIYNTLANQGAPVPPYAWQHLTPAFLLHRLSKILFALPSISSILGLAPFDRFISSLSQESAYRPALGIILLLFLFGTTAGASIFLCRVRRDNSMVVWLLLASTCILVSFLAASSVIISAASLPAYIVLGDGRYYMPVLPAIPIVLISAWGLQVPSTIRRAALAVGISWSAYFCVDTYALRSWRNLDFPLNSFLSKSPVELHSLKGFFKLGSHPPRFSSVNRLDAHYNAIAVHPWLDQLRAEHPQALFFVQHLPYFEYREANSKLRRIPETPYWQHAYASRSVQLFFFVLDDGDAITSSLMRTHVIISNHLPVVKVETRNGWALFTVTIPEATRLYHD